jgi:hypothetical protein
MMSTVNFNDCTQSSTTAAAAAAGLCIFALGYRSTTAFSQQQTTFWRLRKTTKIAASESTIFNSVIEGQHTPRKTVFRLPDKISKLPVVTNARTESL